ncbi:hypothetical protein FRC06_005530 [Ceratobasidium sp. 370]|nr:hypothetical protein FRC06_005530 [Ceratobasidium sp. 370]
MDGSPPDHIVPVGQDTRITSVTGDPASTGSSQSSITDSQGRQQVMAGASEERGIPPSRIGSDLLRFVDFIEVEEQVDESEIPQSPDNKEDTWLPEPIPGFFWAGLEESNSTDDLDRMISLGKSILAHITNDSPKRPRCLGKLGISYLYRFQRLKVLGDIEKAVDCIDGAVALTPLDDPDRPGRLSNLGSAYQLLFKRLGKHDYIHKAVSNKEEAVKLTPDDHPDRPGRLNKLGNAYRSLFECFERPGDINKAVDCFVQAVTLIPAGDPDKPGYLSNLGSAYQSSFKLFGRLDTLDKAVSCQEQAITLTPDGHPNKAVQLNSLGETYRLLFSHYDLSRDAMRALDSFKHAALMSTGPPSVRLRASNNWAQISTSLGSPSLEAYMCSLELLPHVIGLGTSIVDKYQSLAADTRDLVTEAAAVAISMQRHDLAIEWLEHGRCLIWNQLLELRTPFDDLRAAHPGIAGELQEASRLLESASMSESIEQEVTHGAESLLDATEKHRLVAEHREQLIDSARGLPGFDNFLRAPKASEIMHHVRDGAAVILNVHTLRCDALVIQPSTQSICHIPLSSFCHQKAEDARIQLAKCLRSRDTRHPVWIDEDESQTPFQDILAMLWYDVVKPVLDRLCVTVGTSLS